MLRSRVASKRHTGTHDKHLLSRECQHLEKWEHSRHFKSGTNRF